MAANQRQSRHGLVETWGWLLHAARSHCAYGNSVRVVEKALLRTDNVDVLLNAVQQVGRFAAFAARSQFKFDASNSVLGVATSQTDTIVNHISAMRKINFILHWVHGLPEFRSQLSKTSKALKGGNSPYALTSFLYALKASFGIVADFCGDTQSAGRYGLIEPESATFAIRLGQIAGLFASTGDVIVAVNELIEVRAERQALLSAYPRDEDAVKEKNEEYFLAVISVVKFCTDLSNAIINVFFLMDNVEFLKNAGDVVPFSISTVGAILDAFKLLRTTSLDN